MSQSGITGHVRGNVGTGRFHLRPDWEGTRAFSCNSITASWSDRRKQTDKQEGSSALLQSVLRCMRMQEGAFEGTEDGMG